MTSPRRKQDRPIRSVSLTFTFSTTRDEASKVKSEFTHTTYRNGVCTVKIAADNPETISEGAKKLLERVRSPR